MRLEYFPFILMIFFSCAESTIEKTGRERILDSLTAQDYELIIRHPVSMDQVIDSSQWPIIEFEESVFNFDTIPKDTAVSKTFIFTNSGNKSLYILDTRVSCGCTITDYSQSAILPFEKGELKVSFDSSNKFGDQNKHIVVITNGVPSEIVLEIKGFVKTEKIK